MLPLNSQKEKKMRRERIVGLQTQKMKKIMMTKKLHLVVSKSMIQKQTKRNYNLKMKMRIMISNCKLKLKPKRVRVSQIH